MILLYGQTLRIADRFEVESMQLNLEERNSTATITVGPDAPPIHVNDWLKDETEPGAGIIWRVKTVNEAVETRTRTISLEHVIQYLKDRILFGEITPEDISGVSGAEMCDAQQAIEYILYHEPVWAFGSLEQRRRGAYSFNGDSLFTALETITGSMPDLMWEYDLSQMPFKLHIRKQPSDICEMRTDRNITTLKRQIDRTRMYTRFYPIGKNDLHISGDYVSKNENLYGVIAKVETDSTMDTEAKLLEWANDRLNRHAEPLVTVTISGQDLSYATGESLDHLTIGRWCRVPLPEYGTMILERVTKISWADKIREPDRCTITLANELEDVASLLNSSSTSSSSSSKTSRVCTKQDADDHAWFVDTEDHVAMVAECLLGKDENGVNWSRVSEIRVDGEGIHQWVKKCQGDLVVQQAQIDVNEERILQEVIDRSAGDRTLTGKITVEAGKISQIVSAVGADGEVTAASIVLAINRSTGESEAKIDAQHVYIGNEKSTTVISGKCKLSDVTADYIDAKIQTLSVLHGVSARFTGSLRVGSTIYLGNDASDLSKNLANSIKSLQITQSGNTYTLKKQSFLDTDWVNVGSFSRATSLSGAWSGGRLTVTASPQGETFQRGLGAGGATWDGNWATVPIIARWGSSDQYSEDTGWSVSVNAQGRYDAGYEEGYADGAASAGHSITLQGQSRSDGSSTWFTGKTRIFNPDDVGYTLSRGYSYSFEVRCGGASKKYYFTIP